MAKLTRKDARDFLFGMLFETEFKDGESPVQIYELACEEREIPHDDYIRSVFFGVITRSELIDAVIGKYSKGWKAERLSKVSRTVLRIAIYEMLFVDSIHPNISISQAVELSVKYGEDKSKQFVNGVLSAFFKDIDGKDVSEYIAALCEEMNTAASEEGEKNESEDNV